MEIIINNINHVISDFIKNKNFLTKEKKLLNCKYDILDINSFLEEKIELIKNFENNKDLININKGLEKDLNYDLEDINKEINEIFDIENMIYGYKNSLLDFIGDNFTEELYDEIYNDYFSDFWNNIKLDFSKIKIENFDNYEIKKAKNLSNLLSEIDDLESEMNRSYKEYYDNEEEEEESEKEDDYNNNKRLYEDAVKEIENESDDLYTDFNVFFGQNDDALNKIQDSISILCDITSNIFDILEINDEKKLRSKAEKNIDDLLFFYEKIENPKILLDNRKDVISEFLLNGEHFIFFDDMSIIYKKDNKYNIFNNEYKSKELNNIYKSIIKNYVKYINRKNPIIEKYINKKIEEEKYNLSPIIELNNYILENKFLLKKFNISIDVFFDKKYEKLYDKIQEIEYLNKIDVFYKKELSGKYSVLKCEKIEKLFKKWFDANLNEKDFKNYISKKLAKVLNAENMINEFENIINQNQQLLTNWGKEYIFSNFEKLGIESNRFFEKDNIIIVKINNYNECKTIGSTSWCINRSENLYNKYKNNNNEFFILFDLNKEKSDKESMIGFHLSEIDNNGYKINYSHLKNDVTTNEENKNKILKICNTNKIFFNKFYNKKNKKIKLIV